MDSATQAAAEGRVFKFWTTKELRVVEQNFAACGPFSLMAMLPGRSAGSIEQQARKLNLKWKSGRVAEFTPAMDAQITLVYQSKPVKGAISALAASMLMPRHQVSYRANQLGLVCPRFNEPAWSTDEIALLEKHASKSVPHIALVLRRHGFSRSEPAIHIKITRLHIDRQDPNHYTATGLAKLMGVDAKTVLRWIAEEGLPAKRKGTRRTEQQGGDWHWINKRTLRVWICTHPAQVGLRKVDRYWFIDFMAGKA